MKGALVAALYHLGLDAAAEGVETDTERGRGLLAEVVRRTGLLAVEVRADAAAEPEDPLGGLTPTEAFVQAAAAWHDEPRLRRVLEDATHRELAQALIDEVVRRAPRTRVPKWDAKEDDPSARYAEVVSWAKRHLNDIESFVDVRVAPARAEHARLLDARRRAEARMEATAPDAVFTRVRGARNVVFRDSARRNQPDEGGYRRHACDLRAAVLVARGFDAEVSQDTERRDTLRVVSDAPPEVADVLRFWRLDDVRLLATVGAANLKVLFHPMFPYAGYWDWPIARREKREDPSFARMRANEDAHLAVNRPHAPTG